MVTIAKAEAFHQPWNTKLAIKSSRVTAPVLSSKSLLLYFLQVPTTADV